MAGLDDVNPAVGRQRALTVLGAAVSVAALAGVIWWALHQDAPTLPDSPSRLALLAAAIAVYLAGCAARGERWLALLRHNGAEPSRADVHSLVAVGYLGNNVLPARAGDALRVVFLTPRARTDARTVIGTIVAERVLDVALLVGLFVILAYGVLGGIDVPSAGRFLVAALLVAALLAVLAGGALVLHRRGHLRHVLDFLAPMGAATVRMHGRHGVALLAWSVLVWALEWGAWWLTAKAVGLHLAVLDVGYLMGLATIFVLVPSGPGYIGTFDAALIFGLHALGHAGAMTLSYLLLLRFVIAVPITLLGLLALASRFGGIARMKAAVRTG
ncbi:MAG: glycosyltransferase 2 family protein [Solirubrobacteraceae bacterium]|nr:glycosyltransferase 2 family protein [Solirubrobacteraceae bacterium]